MKLGSERRQEDLIDMASNDTNVNMLSEIPEE